MSGFCPLSESESPKKYTDVNGLAEALAPSDSMAHPMAMARGVDLERNGFLVCTVMMPTLCCLLLFLLLKLQNAPFLKDMQLRKFGEFLFFWAL